MALADLKIAVTGATGRAGHALRAALAENDVPPDRVRLLDRESEEAIISEYAGQATLIGTLDPEALADRDVVFFCGSPAETSRSLLWPRKRDALFIDMSGAAASRGEAPVVNVAVSAGPLSGPPPTVAAPHAISYALSTLLAPIASGPGIGGVAAVVLRPAADFGEAGLEELHKQTISLLNFGEVPKETYGRQLAFNLVPQAVFEESGEGEAGLEERVGTEIRRILGWPAALATVRILVAPVFHGHAGFIHVTASRKTTAREISDILKGIAGVSVSASTAAPTPVDIAERPELAVVSVAADGGETPGFWVWMSGGDLHAYAARNAVEIAVRAL